MKRIIAVALTIIGMLLLCGSVQADLNNGLVAYNGNADDYTDLNTEEVILKYEYLGVCGYTDFSWFTLDEDAYVTRIRIKYDLNVGGENITAFLSGPNDEFIESGAIVRGECFGEWCEAIWNVNRLFDAGEYFFIADSESLCENPSGDTTLILYGYDPDDGGNSDSVVILTDSSPDTTITAGSTAQVYGTTGVNHITLESGAEAKLFNVPGSNTVTIKAESSLFTVSRSGATVSFEGTDGTVLKIPATLDSQTIVFNDGSWALIIDSGKVMLGQQEISLEAQEINESSTDVSTAIALSLVTDMDDTKLNNVLSPNKKSTLKLSSLADSNVKVEISTSSGVRELTPSTVSLEEYSIHFTSPVDIIEGNITVKGNNFSTSALHYAVVTAQTPYLTELVTDSAKEGDTVEITGVNLPALPVQVVFEGQDASLIQTVIPANGKVVFNVPSTLGSGAVYLQIAEFQTNRLYLSVKRTIGIQVALGQDISFDPSKISFILGLEEYALDNNYNATLNVENKDMQYLHAIAELPGDEAALLYSAVVFPDITGTVTVNAESTAVAWIFMGMGASVTTPKDQLRSLYDSVAANVKVQEFAAYIDTLQKENFTAWASRSDEVLKIKFQDALSDVIQTSQNKLFARSMMTRETDPNAVIITQDPENSNIYVDDNIYTFEYNTGNKLNNGTVNIVNDTRLFLSVEVRDTKNNEILNNYTHAPSALDNKVIGPKGWPLFGISSLSNMNLNGKDAKMEIIIGAATGTTDKENLASQLKARVFIEGVALPALNMALTTIMDKVVSKFSKPGDPSLAKRVVLAMTDIYGTGFWVQLTEKISVGQSNWSTLVKDFILDPVSNGLKDCYEKGVTQGKCEQTAKGLLELAGVSGIESVGNKLLLTIAEATAKRLGKKSLAVVPVVGWIAQGAFFVYDNVGYVTDSTTIGESLLDMNANPKEINVDVDFPLEVSSVCPTCITLAPSETVQEFVIKGEGFAKDGDEDPEVYMGSGDDKTDSMSVDAPYSEGTEMTATFDAQELVGEGSWSSYLSVRHLGQFIMYDKAIRMVSTEDEKVYFDSVVPNRAMLGQTVTLNGCGWVPLENLKVYFTAEGEDVEGEILSKEIDKIEVKVPQTAKSGLIRVTTGKKESIQLFDVIPFGLFSTTTDMLKDGKEFALEGKGLADTAGIYFKDRDDNIIAGTPSNITDTSMWVKTPDGLKTGLVRIYVLLNDGMKSNELTLPKVPQSPTVSLTYGVIGNDGLTLTLSQEEGTDIYYRLNDNTPGTEIKYTEPITLSLNDLKYTELFFYPFARASVSGVNYDSDISNITGYTYDACNEGETFDNINKECVIFTPEKTYSFADWQAGTCPQGFTYSIHRSGDYEYHRCRLTFYDTYNILTVKYSDNIKVNEKYDVIIPKDDGQEHDYNFRTYTVREITYASDKITADTNNTIIKDEQGVWRSARTSSMSTDPFYGAYYSITTYDLEHMTPLLYSNIWGTVAKRTDQYTLDGKKVKETLYESKLEEDRGYIAKETQISEWDADGTPLYLGIYEIKRNASHNQSEFLEEWQSMLKESTQWKLSGTIRDCYEDTTSGYTYECIERAPEDSDGFTLKKSYDLRQRDSGVYAGEWVSILAQKQLLYQDGRTAMQTSCTSVKNDYGSWVSDCDNTEVEHCLDGSDWCTYDGYGF